MLNSRMTICLLAVVWIVGCGKSASQSTAAVAPLASASASESAKSPRGNKRFVKAEGRLAAYPGAEVELSTEIAGTIERILVEEKQAVKKGDLIVALKSTEERAALSEAKAKLAEVKSNLWFFEREVARAEKLAKSNTIAASTLEQAQRDRDAARARFQEAQATVERLQAVFEKTQIHAPIDGVVTARYVHPGETLQARVPIVKIVDLNRLRIEAEIDEYDTGRLAVGNPVRVTAEGYPESWNAKVEQIPDVVVRKKSQPDDPARPSDTRVLMVKIALGEKTPLKLGQRVEVEIALP